MISLGTEQTISKVAMIINGESSFGVNQQNIIEQIFGWQADSMALSVSELALEKVRKYIANQEEHHSAKKNCTGIWSVFKHPWYKKIFIRYSIRKSFGNIKRQ